MRASKLCRVNFSINISYTGHISWEYQAKIFLEIDLNPTTADADAPASRID